jgi:hypothetical protein
MVVFTHGCVGGGLINSRSVGVPSFVIAKVVVIYLGLGFLTVLVYKLAKVQTCISISQLCFC